MVGVLAHDVPLDERAGAALLRCVARWGWRRTRFEDVAREAGFSRATLYRAVPGGKDALLAFAIDAEVRSLREAIADALSECRDLDDAIVAVVLTTGRALASDKALEFVLQHETEVVLPHVCFAGAASILGAAAEAGEQLFGRWCSPMEARHLGEWIGRLVIGHLLLPSPYLDLTDRDSVSRLVRHFAPTA